MDFGSTVPPRRRSRGGGRSGVVAGAVFSAISLISMAINGAAQATGVSPLVVDLYFDLAADSLAGLDVAAADVAFAGDRMEIAGIPVRIDTEEGDVGWRTVAGARGSYTAALGHGLSLVGRANLANTDFVDAATADSTVGRAGGELRYAAGGGWVVGLQPVLEITRWSDGRRQRDMIAEGRVGAPIREGVRLAATAHYRWRAAGGRGAGGGAADREIAGGRLGIVCDLPREARLEMALNARHETGIDDSVASAGPSLALALPLGETMDLSANYSFTETARQPANAGAAGDSDGLHHLGMAMRWDVGGDAADIDLSAAYNLERRGAAAANRLHLVGTVGLALNF